MKVFEGGSKTATSALTSPLENAPLKANNLRHHRSYFPCIFYCMVDVNAAFSDLNHEL